MDTPLPLAGDLQLQIPGAARPPHPQITFQLSHREVTPHRQPHGVFDTHVVCMPVCIHMYSQQEVSHLISKFWAETRDGYMCVSVYLKWQCQAVPTVNSHFKDFSIVGDTLICFYMRNLIPLSCLYTIVATVKKPVRAVANLKCCVVAIGNTTVRHSCRIHSKLTQKPKVN